MELLACRNMAARADSFQRPHKLAENRPRQICIKGALGPEIRFEDVYARATQCAVFADGVVLRTRIAAQNRSAEFCTAIWTGREAHLRGTKFRWKSAMKEPPYASISQPESPPQQELRPRRNARNDVSDLDHC
jgi:hypothetical protein